MINSDSCKDFPFSFIIPIFSTLLKISPSSLIILTASRIILAKYSLKPDILFVFNVVLTALISDFSSSSKISCPISSNSFKVLFNARLKPLIIIDGCTPLSINSKALLNKSPANITTLVVPSPIFSFCTFDKSTAIFAEAFSISMPSSIVNPSLVIVMSPSDSTIILSIPFGPYVDFIASETAITALTFAFKAFLLPDSSVPSLNMIIGCPIFF